MFRFFRNFLRSFQLTSKLVVIILFLNLAMVAVLFFLYKNLPDKLFKNVEKHTEEITKAIQVGVGKLATQEYTETEVLTEYLNNLKTKGIGEINIVNTDQDVIASTNTKNIGKKFNPVNKKVVNAFEYGEKTDDDNLKKYNVMFPVVVGNELFGYVHISMLLEDFTNILRKNYVDRLIATFVVFSFGILAAIFLAMRYTRPIHMVVKAAQKVAAGDLSQIIQSNRMDEIGNLTKNFNDMVIKLREQKELKERLAKVEHLSKIGQLASGIAHEIKNPLNFINLSIDHLGSKYSPQDSKSKEKFNGLLSNIKDEIHRLKNLIENFLNYGKPLRLHYQFFNIEALLQHTLSLVAVRAEEQGIAIKKINFNCQEIYGDPELLKTCFLNIILNAFQAMPEGGLLKIDMFPSKREITVHFTDNGNGIPDDVINKIFEPYFTTKEPGLGLGLSITKQIIEKHHGTVHLETNDSGGTTAKIVLPLISREDVFHKKAFIRNH